MVGGRRGGGGGGGDLFLGFFSGETELRKISSFFFVDVTSDVISSFFCVCFCSLNSPSSSSELPDFLGNRKEPKPQGGETNSKFTFNLNRN